MKSFSTLLLVACSLITAVFVLEDFPPENIENISNDRLLEHHVCCIFADYFDLFQQPAYKAYAQNSIEAFSRYIFSEKVLPALSEQCSSDNSKSTCLTPSAFSKSIGELLKNASPSVVATFQKDVALIETLTDQKLKLLRSNFNWSSDKSHEILTTTFNLVLAYTHVYEDLRSLDTLFEGFISRISYNYDGYYRVVKGLSSLTSHCLRYYIYGFQKGHGLYRWREDFTRGFNEVNIMRSFTEVVRVYVKLYEVFQSLFHELESADLIDFLSSDPNSTSLKGNKKQLDDTISSYKNLFSYLSTEVEILPILQSSQEFPIEETLSILLKQSFFISSFTPHLLSNVARISGDLLKLVRSRENNILPVTELHSSEISRWKHALNTYYIQFSGSKSSSNVLLMDLLNNLFALYRGISYVLKNVDIQAEANTAVLQYSDFQKIRANIECILKYSPKVLNEKLFHICYLLPSGPEPLLCAIALAENYPCFPELLSLKDRLKLEQLFDRFADFLVEALWLESYQGNTALLISGKMASLWKETFGTSSFPCKALESMSFLHLRLLGCQVFGKYRSVKHRVYLNDMIPKIFKCLGADLSNSVITESLYSYLNCILLFLNLYMGLESPSLNSECLSSLLTAYGFVNEEVDSNDYVATTAQFRKKSNTMKKIYCDVAILKKKIESNVPWLKSSTIETIAIPEDGIPGVQLTWPVEDAAFIDMPIAKYFLLCCKDKKGNMINNLDSLFSVDKNAVLNWRQLTKGVDNVDPSKLLDFLLTYCDEFHGKRFVRESMKLKVFIRFLVFEELLITGNFAWKTDLQKSIFERMEKKTVLASQQRKNIGILSETHNKKNVDRSKRQTLPSKAISSECKENQETKRRENEEIMKRKKSELEEAERLKIIQKNKEIELQRKKKENAEKLLAANTYSNSIGSLLDLASFSDEKIKINNMEVQDMSIIQQQVNCYLLLLI